MNVADFPSDELHVTQHHVTIDGRSIAYTAIAGTLVLSEEVEPDGDSSDNEKARARLFFVAYLRSDVPDDAPAGPIARISR